MNKKMLCKRGNFLILPLAIIFLLLVGCTTGKTSFAVKNGAADFLTTAPRLASANPALAIGSLLGGAALKMSAQEDLKK